MNPVLRVRLSRIAVAAATVCLFLAALFAVCGRTLFLPGPFADRTADSLGDRGVATFVADRITSEIIAQKPNLIGARPLILAAVTSVIGSDPFRAVVRTAARRVHEAVFSENSRNVVLSIPDFDVLVQGALAQTAPDVAKKVPRGLTAKLADLGANRQLELIVDLWRVGRQVRWLSLVALLAGPLFLAGALWVAPQRHHGLVRCSIGVGIAGFALLTLIPAARIVAALVMDDVLIRNAVDGALRTYLAGLRVWGVFFVGIGVLFAAAGSVLVQTVDVGVLGRRMVLKVVSLPSGRGLRVVRGLSLLAAGVLVILFSHEFVSGAVVLLGTLVAFAGVRELFRLILSSTADIAMAAQVPSHTPVWRTAAVLGVALCVAVIWGVTRNPTVSNVTATAMACNGHPELCDRTVDQVVFAGAHNSMSNAQITDWMFPHHMKAIPGQLDDGIRALLIDVHRGFPGAARIKTDIEGEAVTQDRIEGALGPEGVAAAMRIRERLVGVDEKHPMLYLCHGFCELGAYELVPTLREVRDFLIKNPNEVLIIVLEDYVTLEELVTAFDESELRQFVYTGPSAPWPTLRELIQSGQRAIVFIESGHTGVSWLRPTLGNIQETPYTYHAPSEFSCAPNRGGTQGSLFQINHWIQTTPAPKPENAVLVNAKDVLLTRARRCAAERKHLPNILAVDFYSIGDLFAVVDSLNGIGKPAFP